MKIQILAAFAVAAFAQFTDAARIPYWEKAESPDDLGWFQGSTYQEQDRETKLE